MAKLRKLPGQQIIDGYKGKIDFYLWMGIPVARAWPRSPAMPRSPAVQAQWPAFSWASKNWTFLPSYIQQAYNHMAVGTNLTGRDMFTKSFINGAPIILGAL